MKKFKNLLLIISIMILVSSCSNNSNNNTENENTPETTVYNFLDLADEVIVTDSDVTFTDATGEEVTIQKHPQKVVSLVNSYTALWYEAGGSVVGRLDSENELPKEALDPNIQTLGKITSVNMELLLSLEPDLVLLRTSKQQDLIPQLKENNIPYISMEYDSFDDYLKWLKVFTALNNNDDLFNTLGLQQVDKVNEILSKVPKENNPDVMLIFGTSSSLKAYLSNTANGQMLEQLGANNIADSWENTDARSIDINTEYLIESNPDFIFVQCMNDPSDVKSLIDSTYGTTNWWQDLSAVKNNNVIYLDRDLYHFKPNKRYSEAYENLAKILYPDIY